MLFQIKTVIVCIVFFGFSFLNFHTELYKAYSESVENLSLFLHLCTSQYTDDKSKMGLGRVILATQNSKSQVLTKCSFLEGVEEYS